MHGSMVIQEAAAHVEATLNKTATAASTSTGKLSTATMAKAEMIDRPGAVGINVMRDEGSERKDEQ